MVLVLEVLEANVAGQQAVLEDLLSLASPSLTPHRQAWGQLRYEQLQPLHEFA